MGGNWLPQISDEKNEMLRTILNEDTRMSFENCRHSSWDCIIRRYVGFRNANKALPIRATNASKVNYLGKQNTIRFWRYFQNELRTIPEHFKRMEFSKGVNFRHVLLSRSKLSGKGSERPSKVYQIPNNGSFVMVWKVIPKKK